LRIAVSHRDTETQRRRREVIAEKASFLFLLCGSVALWLSISIRNPQSEDPLSFSPSAQ
jgi:hypothetical protein